MSRRRSISPVSLRDIYPYLGRYSAKFLIDPRVAAAHPGTAIKCWNSDGKEMPIEFRRWGTKLTLSFTIDESVPDGVSVIDISLTGSGRSTNERFDFWVIK